MPALIFRATMRWCTKHAFSPSATGHRIFLLRLKELESLERLVEKAGRVNLRAGEGRGFDALLSNLVRLKASESAYGKGRISDGAAFPAFAAASSARARPQNISFGAGDCGR